MDREYLSNLIKDPGVMKMYPYVYLSYILIITHVFTTLFTYMHTFTCIHSHMHTHNFRSSGEGC